MTLPLLLPLSLAAALQWLDPASVKPQQKGVCVTEWTGGERREIPVEIMGVLDATSPERTAVLVRLLDPKLSGEGVVAGMSGSPVFVDGKLLGALAFGWGFAKEPIGGVTPFASMQRIEAGGETPHARPPTAQELAGLAAGKLEPRSVLPAMPDGGSPRRWPLAVAGLPATTGFGREILTAAGLDPVSAGAGADVSGVPEPGEMIAVLLVWGDATLAAGGTVTARDGDRLWAFGHPLFALGKVAIPAARARVLAIHDSYQVPFKLFAVGQQFGTVVADRTPGILVRTGPAPEGLPLSVSTQGPGGEATWRFRVARVPLLEPLLATFLTNACLTTRGASVGEAMVRIELTLRFADGSNATTRQAGRGTDAVARIASFVGAAVGFFENSPLPRPELAALEVATQRDEDAAGATMVEAVPARTTVRAGEEVLVSVRMLPHRAAPETVTLAVRVPSDTPEGPLDLIVADGAAWADYVIKAQGFVPTDFADQKRLFGMLEPSSTLIAALESRDRGVAVAGRPQPDLPPSWSATLATGLGARGGLTRLSSAVVAVSRWQAPYPLDGAFRVPLVVRAPREVP